MFEPRLKHRAYYVKPVKQEAACGYRVDGQGGVFVSWQGHGRDAESCGGRTQTGGLGVRKTVACFLDAG